MSGSESPEFMEEEHPLDETIQNRPVDADTVLQLISKCRYGRDDLLKLLRGIQTIIRQIAPDLNESNSSDSDFTTEGGKRRLKENLASEQESTNKKGKPEDPSISQTTSQISQFQDLPLDSQNLQFSQYSTSQIQNSGANSTAPAQSSGQITSQQVSEAVKNATKSNTKPPAIIIRSNQNWTATRKFLMDNNIAYKSVFNTSHGNKIQTPDMETYRKALKLLRERDLQHYTFLPAEERDLHVVIRGSGMELSPEDVDEFLKAKGFSPIKIIRMVHPIDRTQMPLLLVILPKDAKGREIYNIKEIWDINVSVEPLQRSPVVGQCRRCLLFGHNHTQCFAAYKCKHCAGDHSFSDCPAKDGPKKCANCHLDHRASFRGCKRAPARRFIPSQGGPQPRRAPAPAPSFNTRSFPNLPNSQISASQPTSYQHKQPPRATAAQALKKGLNNPPNQTRQNIPNTQIDNQLLLQQMQATMQNMAAMFASMCKLFGQK